VVRAVCGIGPRVGSSFVMRQSKIAGLPVRGTKYLHGRLPVAGNPGGYYCQLPEEVRDMTEGVGKVWPLQLRFLTVPASKIVVLERRDLDAQRESIIKQSTRELFEVDPDEIIRKSASAMAGYIEAFEPEVMIVATEELNDKIQDIINFLGE